MRIRNDLSGSDVANLTGSGNTTLSVAKFRVQRRKVNGVVQLRLGCNGTRVRFKGAAEWRVWSIQVVDARYLFVRHPMEVGSD
jgi:hypothetical protein